MLSQNPRHFLSLALIVLTPNPNPSLRLLPQLFSYQSWLSFSGNHLIKWPSLSPSPSPSPPPSSLPNPNSDPKFSQDDLSTIANLLADPTVASLRSELDRVGIYPSPSLVQAVFDRFDSSPKLLHTLFVWAEDLPGFQCSVKLFGSVIDVLAKAREFESVFDSGSYR